MLSIRVSDRLFLKDPESSPLGRNILTTSVQIIDEIGMERFTFKKLANTLQTTESSVYRYFENKHMLLLYMSTWYWSWLETYVGVSHSKFNGSERQTAHHDFHSLQG